MENYGADAVRTYLAFIGPYEDTYPWNPNGLVACARLVKSIYEAKDKVSSTVVPNQETQKLLNIMIKKMTSMMGVLKMNTAVSEIMKFNNHLKKMEVIDLVSWKEFLKTVAPFMPFVTEELWQEANFYSEWKKENSIHLQSWPKFNEILTQEEILQLPVQVNGKLKGTIQIEPGLSEKEMLEKALELEPVKQAMTGKSITKTIVVQGKILNIVVA
jgi:leucyl-tRNA synthetase